MGAVGLVQRHAVQVNPPRCNVDGAARGEEGKDGVMRGEFVWGDVMRVCVCVQGGGGYSPVLPVQRSIGKDFDSLLFPSDQLCKHSCL